MRAEMDVVLAVIWREVSLVPRLRPGMHIPLKKMFNIFILSIKDGVPDIS